MTMTFSNMLRPILTSACLVLLLAGCSSKDDDVYVERTVEELYNHGMDMIGQGAYKTAAKAFDEVERQHPYSVWATKAQLMAAYALYENSGYDDAINMTWPMPIISRPCVIMSRLPMFAATRASPKAL